MPKKLALLSVSLIAVSGVLAVYSKNNFRQTATVNGGVFGSATTSTLNLPQEIVIPEDSKILSTIKSRSGSQITIETATSELDLKALWKRNLTKNGWRETEDFRFVKGEKTVTISLTTDTSTKNTIATVSFFDSAALR